MDDFGFKRIVTLLFFREETKKEVMIETDDVDKVSLMAVKLPVSKVSVNNCDIPFFFVGTNEVRYNLKE